MSTKLLLHLDGNSIDSASPANTMTELGPISYEAGKFGQAFKNENSPATIQGPSFGDIGSGDFTMEAFFKIPLNDGASRIFSHGEDFSLYLSRSNNGNVDPRTVLVRYNNDQNIIETDRYSSAGQVLNDNQWHHVALVRQSGAIKIYVDGQEKTFMSGLTTAPFTVTLSPSSKFLVGVYQYSGTIYAGGLALIDEIRVSDTAVYTGNFTVPTEPFGGSSGQQSQASLQVKKKFFQPNAIDETKTLFNNNGYFVAKKVNGSEKQVFKVNAQNKIEFADEIIVPAATADANAINKGQLSASVAAEQSRAMAAESSISAAVAAEQSRAMAAEGSLSAAAAAAVSAEESRAMAAEGSLSSDLAAEVSRAGIAESSLQSQINAIDNGSSASTVAEESRAMAAEASLAADIAAEQSRAMAAEGSLSSDLAAEVSRATAAEGWVQSQIDSIISNTDPAALDSLTEIVDAFQNADTATTTAINNLSASAAADLAAEESRAMAAEASIAASIAAEESRAMAAEGQLTSDLAAEVSRATAAEGSLSSDLTAEASRAMAAEGQLTSDLAAEVSRAGIAEASVAASIAAEASRAGAAEGQLTSDLAAEVSRATAAESSISAAVSAEQSRAMAAEGQLTSDLAAEASRAGAAEGSLSSDLSAEQSRATAAESVLTSDLAAEVSRATAAEGSLQSQINNLISNNDPAALDSMAEIVAAFQGADGDLSTAISNLASSVAADLAAEESRAMAAEGSLSSDLAAEASRAGAAESALDIRLDVLEAIVNEKEKFVLVSQDITNGYIELAHAAAVKSTFITVERLPIHEGEDYTISVVGGKTRITFIGSMIGSGVEALVADDVVLVEYSY